MNPLIQLKTTPPLLITLALLCFALLPKAQAVAPPPDGGYPGGNTAEGTDALFTLTTGYSNTGLGFKALYHDTIGAFNTAAGDEALFSNTTGDANTATGRQALFSNTTGGSNTANGFNALASNSTGNVNTATGGNALSHNADGSYNTATGFGALLTNTTGDSNTANGFNALASNSIGNGNTAAGREALFRSTTGGVNTATGFRALEFNTTGDGNTATGLNALDSNSTGSGNTATGRNVLFRNTTGNGNTAIGQSAGSNQTTGSDNVYIGLGVPGVPGERSACYIASIFNQTSANGVPVLINSNNKLGTSTSSKRFKEDIKAMDKASEALFALKPVCFRYKKEIDPAGISQLGLVAEDVAKVNPDLVVWDTEGKPYTVRYDQVNAMLLNEFLKEHRKNEEQETTIAELKSGMAALAATVKEQAAQIQNVSAQLEASKPAPQVVNNP
jgi:hypothetical protein